VIEQRGIQDRSSFGDELRRYRTSRGLSLRALSESVHYSKGHLSKVETGGKQASAQLARICDEVLGAGGELLRAHRPAGLGGPVVERYKPAQLPMATVPFTGRTRQLAELDTALEYFRARPREAAAVIVVDGMAGVGKTALILQWAHRVAGQFPGGILFHDLLPGGVPSDPAEVLAAFLRALGVPIAEIPPGTPERASLYRTLLARRRVLVVLDSAVSAEQVRPQLPGVPGSLVLIGSRDRLAGLVARDGAVRVTVQPLSAGESCELLREVADKRQTSMEPAVMAELVGRCGHLPLALRIAASAVLDHGSGAPNWPPDTGAWLDVLSAGGDEEASVRAAFDRSYRALSEDAASAFRLLGAHAGAGISLAAAAVLLGTDEENAWRRLDPLYQVHLVEQPSRGRYRIHCLLRLYVQEMLAADREHCQEADRRLLEWYRRTAREALKALLTTGEGEAARGATGAGEGPVRFLTPEQAWQWCQEEERNLLSAVEHAARLTMDELSSELLEISRNLSLLRYGDGGRAFA
jgi:transcriptional regulator with XRE-family HTH domain